MDISKTMRRPVSVSQDTKNNFSSIANKMVPSNPDVKTAVAAQAGKIDPKTASDALRYDEDISEDIYESRLYKMKLAGYFD
jgi:hypothetical protein